MPVRRLVRLVPAIAFVTAVHAAEPEWIKLQAPSFGILSQLGERDTRRWAVEFDQFIGAMHTLYNVEELDLPPLTIVLFDKSREFAPYRMQTDSGQTQVAGFFGRTLDWSVIGLSGAGRDSITRPVIYHEAVHWFASASSTEPPLWFSEGLAEVLSTFRVVDGKGRWGEVIQGNVDYLGLYGLMPLEDLLRASQDQALHGRGSSKYYPQSWALVHYLIFGDSGAQSSKLSAFLREQQETDLDTAFESAFGKSYDEFNAELRRYLRGGRYTYAEIGLRDRSGEMTVDVATEGNVEFALGRLATAGGNHSLALAHADRVVQLAPSSPAGYELKAYVAAQLDDDADIDAMLDRAIELGSKDAQIYATKAERLLAASAADGGFLDELVSADVAREIANLYIAALELRPRNASAFGGLALALLNIDAHTHTDRAALNAGRQMFPSNGLLLVGQAAVAKQSGNERDAIGLLRQAVGEPYTLPRGMRTRVSALRDHWLGGWLSAEITALIAAGELDEAQAFIAERLADDTMTGAMRTALANWQRDLRDAARMLAAAEMGRVGRESEALEMLRALVNDPSTGERARRAGEQALQELGGRTSPTRE